MIPFSGVTAMALSGTMTTVLATVAIGTISGKLVGLYHMNDMYLLLDCVGMMRMGSIGSQKQFSMSAKSLTIRWARLQHIKSAISSSELLFDYIGEPCEQLQIL